MRRLLPILLFAATASAQGFSKLDPAPPTGITVDQIITRMGQREADFAAARNNYVFRQDARFETISDDTGKPDGQWRQVSDVGFGTGGAREEKVIFAPASSIERVILTENDMKDLEHRLPFVLTAPELPQYNITYLGRQRVDDVDTYVLDVAPKELVKGKRYFQGKVWVDQQEFQIVLCSGLNVPQEVRPGHEDLSPPFTTYYQQVDGKYWFPVYTKAEGILHFAAQHGALSQDVHIRDVVRYTDYRRYRSSSTIIFNGQEVEPEKDSKQPPPPQPDKPKP